MSETKNLSNEELSKLYTKINDTVTTYIIENESSISEDNETSISEEIAKIFDEIATKMIREYVTEISETFENMNEEEQQKYITLGLKGVKKAMIQEMKNE